MGQLFEGNLIGTDLRIAIVVSRFNEFITKELLSGAKDALKRHGVNPEQIDIAWVPGAFELPLFADQLAATRRYDAVIALGAVIRGSTSHYDYVCNEAAKGIAAASIRHQLPVLFGVITTENIEQAIERSGTKAGNKGWEIAVNAIELANLQQQINR